MSVPRMTIDTMALAGNWRALAAASGAAACGAAIKADAYGLGAQKALEVLTHAGCRDFFVASWPEAEALGALPPGVRVAVLHGVTARDMAKAQALGPAVVPVLNTPAQVLLWRSTGRPADLMVDTGINRLGLDMADVQAGVTNGLHVHTLHSHLACADTPDHPMNGQQLQRFRAVAAHVPATRRALANTAGVLLGADWHFDLTRPGLGLYGGMAGRAGMAQVVRLHAPVVQLRDLPAGAGVGYGASFVARAPLQLATVALGYADGYPRALQGWGHALHAGQRLPVVGRVSMDLITIDVTALSGLAEGDWLELDFDLPAAARASARSEYELLTGLGRRYVRVWT